jgi:hypothetical protein
MSAPDPKTGGIIIEIEMGIWIPPLSRQNTGTNFRTERSNAISVPVIASSRRSNAVFVLSGAARTKRSFF